MAIHTENTIHESCGAAHPPAASPTKKEPRLPHIGSSQLQGDIVFLGHTAQVDDGIAHSAK